MSYRFLRIPHTPRQRDRLLGSAIARAMEGDRSAFHFLYVRYADEVHGHVDGIVRDRHEAETVTQTLFARLMRAAVHDLHHRGRGARTAARRVLGAAPMTAVA